ncbi:MAG: glycosyltransferase family 39 protein [Deltaproteobacteria bacterium]|nr:glycosyltransferase family 39 protein [Deltaproteobacteria bacterium]
MRERLSSLLHRPSGQVGFLLVFCFVLFFINLGQWDLWNPDEPRYAQVAREMVNGGDWIMMHFNGQMYADKPPLFFWLIAFSSFLWQGFSSFSVRFPSAFFGTLSVLLTFLIGKRLYSPRTGFLAGLTLVTSLEFAYLSTRANIDATLTFFTTLSLLCFLEWYRGIPPHPRIEYGAGSCPLPKGEREDVGGCPLPKGEKENGADSSLLQRERESIVGSPFLQEKQEGKKSLIIYGFYIGMALATLAKGPVGFILPLLVVLVYLAVQKDWNGIKRMKLIQGMILFILIVLAWYLPALLKGGREYFNETILLHTVDRFAKGSSHIRPFYYYFYNFPGDFLPWIFFLPAAIAYGFSGKKTGIKREFLFLFVWFAVIFIFFSFSKGKRGLYLLPFFPAVSLMVGQWWDDHISGSIKSLHHRWFSIPLWIFSGLLFGLGVGIPWVVSTKFPSYLSYSLPIALLFAGGAIALFILYRLRYRAAIFFLIVGIIGGGVFYAQRVIFPIINPYKSARFISQEVTSRIQPGERLAIYGDFVTAPYNYYTGIIPILEIEKRDEFIRFLQSGERVFCFLKFRDFAQFQAMEGRPRVELIARRNVGGDDMVLISNRED